MRCLPLSSLALFVLCALSLAACGHAPVGAPISPPPTPQIVERLPALADARIVLLGEQHDAAEHHRIERDVVAALTARDRLATLALEMAERGRTTAALARDASEDDIRKALDWKDTAWPWADYGPAIVAAVRAGVPVVGTNVARDALRASMGDASLDGQLPGPALKAQQQAIRIGHCNQLPETQITPMTRAQIARDRSMAEVLVQQAGAARTGQQVLLIAGAGHVDRFLGVPQHLPRELKVVAVRMQAANAQSDRASQFDIVWPTEAVPERDHCAEFMRAMPGQSPAPAK